MLSSLLLFLLFETVQPSSAAFTFMPSQFQAGVLAPNMPNAPTKKGNSIGPVLQATSVFAIDLTTGTPLYEHDIFSRRPIASIAKLVTAMVILDNHSILEKTVVSKNAAGQEGSTMSLEAEEEINVGDLLRGMLINSGNDAAVALAEFDAGNERAFVAKMNQKVADLGLNDTHFSNAKGFDEPENYSTAYDTMIFSRTALSYAFIRNTAVIKNMEVTSTDAGLRHRLESTNELLGNSHFKVVGLKTGTTPAAGQSFVSLAEAANSHEILAVMLDSPSRFTETKILLDWIFRNFEFNQGVAGP